MKTIKNIGLTICFIGFAIFTASIFIGTNNVSQETFNTWTKQKVKSEFFIEKAQSEIVNKELSAFELSSKIVEIVKASNEFHKSQKEIAWDKIIYLKWNKTSKDFIYPLTRASVTGWPQQNQWLFFLLTFGLAILGGSIAFASDYKLLGPAGIKNNGIFQHSATNRGYLGIFAFIFFVGFYMFLYFFPNYLVNPILSVNPISKGMSGNESSQWFLYGFMYCSVMSVFAIRMFIKYRHNNYQILRTAVVLFFQIAFAFVIPEILVAFNQPWFDFKNAFPLNYSFFFDWNINNLLASGNMGIFMLVWGILLTLVIVPVMVYFYGKRWYCSWVCGCGGLAETLGDPYRQLSSKSLFSWKVERWLIHGVLVFALGMTALTLYTYFAEIESWKEIAFGISAYDIQTSYGFFIGSIFSGVIGTGFYPILGNRVWCRFGCPLAAYMGFVQRFKSRFRITTNGGQCISCGNCSTYCEQGIDVRSYAQKGENIVRSSCVGCGICSAVCPRGVLKLENGPEKGRINPTDVLLGNDVNLMELVNEK
ncbi:FeS-binding protein [Tenacibaculum sp. Bg11-29]|uniref:4Fe-4S binding protein n=1 Tax=Tenacibaculum sp. Bg11-29 TaxID=2058306 RepID=UPI000C328C64|nr:4Fe-4S dicluster domain-containing protein [Tenacibaculum sp. Bg11-29]PKH49724.1 FeS-binding protein [Tenacibaculum sp. Bg11-29]